MAGFMFTAKKIVDVITYVEANTLEDAMDIASRRNLGNGNDESQNWVMENFVKNTRVALDDIVLDYMEGEEYRDGDDDSEYMTDEEYNNLEYTGDEE